MTAFAGNFDARLNRRFPTSLTDPPKTIKYLPEQIVRAMKQIDRGGLLASRLRQVPMPMLG